ncbi:MAG: DUF1565 domain-containing protein, partial [Thermoleophilaceae bacterium]
MRARAAALVTIVLAALVVSAGMADDASARKRSFRPAATERGMLVFRLHGVRPRTVRSAALRVGRRTRRLPARRVRRAAGRGLLRVRAGKTARAGVRGPRLFVWTRATSNRHLRVDADALHVSPAGDDRNPGTAAAPWSTLTHAAEEAGPGATVVVHAGTYSAPGRIVRFARDGASDAPITFAGAAGEAPPRLLGQLRIDGDHVRVHNFLVDGPTGPVAERSSDNP